MPLNQVVAPAAPLAPTVPAVSDDRFIVLDGATTNNVGNIIGAGDTPLGTPGATLWVQTEPDGPWVEVNESTTIGTVFRSTVTIRPDGSFDYTAPARNHTDVTADVDSFLYKLVNSDGTGSTPAKVLLVIEESVPVPGDGFVDVDVPVDAALPSVGTGTTGTTATGTGSSGNTLSDGAQSVLAILGEGGDKARWNFDQVVGHRVDSLEGIGTGVTLTYSFLTSLPDYYYSSQGVDSSKYQNMEAFNAYQKAAVVSAFEKISQVANITFREAADGEVGEITFAKAEQDTGVTGRAYYPSFSWTSNGKTEIVTSADKLEPAGDVWISKDAYWNDQYGSPDIWEDGGVGFGVLLHEIGHALGLKHTFDFGSFVLPAGDPFDNHRHSIMSYTGAENSFVFTGDNQQYASLQPSTMMPFDVEALQYLYGANTSSTSGNNTYTWEENQEFLQTLWDAGGTDTIDASNQSGNCIINLNAGMYSSIGIHAPPSDWSAWYTGKDNLAIAKNVVIENAKGGSGDDIFFANAANNRLEGGSGNDTYAGYTCGIATGHDLICDTAGTADVLEIANAKADAALRAVIISHTGDDLVLTLPADDSITLEQFYNGYVIETLTGTDWSIDLAGVASQLDDGTFTTLESIFS